MTVRNDIRVRRIYEDVQDDDGARVLVDRVWPRGMRKESAALYEWCRDVAPSTDLRKWYSHVRERFPEFRRRYEVELAGSTQSQAVQHLRALTEDDRLTLLTATKEPDISAARVLEEVLRR